ncbi:hypothetical protein [Paraburkholderia terrae]
MIVQYQQQEAMQRVLSNRYAGTLAGALTCARQRFVDPVNVRRVVMQSVTLQPVAVRVRRTQF